MAWVPVFELVEEENHKFEADLNSGTQKYLVNEKTYI